ncbi:hypothetical protein O181_053254 [Austropuccinia psidii MF-1]|uniref:Uncharacterized protein n=1 Tax=Austropuccinia psidii MF-1 TaxID=1389203 RepID=A0A9Q3E2A2_9BASI|nr:hypothetical protein [Austropuccinia psidii MF-1]
MNKLFNVCQNIKPQRQSHVFGNTPYHQEDIKPDSPIDSKQFPSSKLQDGENMTFSYKEELKQLAEETQWPKFPGVGEYDHMELIHYICQLFIDVPIIPDYWIISRMNKELKVYAIIWYTEMKEIHRRINWQWWKSKIIQK